MLMGTKPQHYCLKWNNYQSHVAEIFVQLLLAESMVDVTLCVEGEKIYAHRIVLSACSPYFQDILSNTEDSHPIIILSEMNSEDIKSIIEFVYRGELNVTADRFTSVLKAAEELRIRGLMEVSSHLPVLSNDTANEVPLENQQTVDSDLDMIKVDTQTVDVLVESPEDLVIPQPTSDQLQVTEKDTKEVLFLSDKGDEEDKKRKRRKETSKKDYSEAMLLAALDDLRAGRSLVETAAAHRIPRSTLYVRARAQGVAMTITRQEHSGERVQAAVQAVTDGASLQQASELYKIPKTVLWRRVQKEGGSYTMSRRARMKQTYGSEKKQAAVRALERGENLSKVSLHYQIPKTTLFREKARLVEAGRLPWTCLRKHDPDADGFKQHRLSEAVAACKEGKMSQAVASLTFQVPKTTIWRRLQQGSKIEPSPTARHERHQEVTETIDNEVDTAVAQLQEQPEFSFQEVPAQIPVTYIDETEFPEASLIILTTDDGNGITLQEEEQLIVETQTVTTTDEGTEKQTVIHCKVDNSTDTRLGT
ncbi:transcription activator GAGA isoform X3 [Anabrus simplex]|uniref:transcription activator GAGA isoform X3 n=1 Tax=Anabrus simplex TaxID=316456 RepID=UPI0035A398D3